MMLAFQMMLKCPVPVKCPLAAGKRSCDCVDETYELIDIFAHTCTHLLMVSGWAVPSFNDSFVSSHHAWI